MRCAVVLAVLVGTSLAARIDELFRARCAAGCIDAPKRNKCESECSLVTDSKPGECPSADEMGRFEGACIYSCSQDRDCTATDKCCEHPCGKTCQPASHLDRNPGLPGVPVNVTVSEARRARSVVVRWAVTSTTSRVLYVLQERKHLGETLQPELFGSWRARSRRRHTRVVLTDFIPAHWYQVRVAAVNSNGTQGFSLPSKPFTLDAVPNKPGEPRNLTVVRPGWLKDKLCAELRWRRPPSDIPLHHYKVSWSHCVQAGDLTNPDNYCKANSVIVNHKSVNYVSKSTYFILGDLLPSSLYIIQVQAVTVPYGLKKKLVSEKAVVFINTNMYINATYDWKPHAQSLVKNLRLSKFYRTNTNNLEVKVMWESAPGRFLVKWAPTSNCVANKPSYNANTKAFYYELDHLIFNCKYQVSVMAISSKKSARLSFSTPSCSQVNSRLPCNS